MASSMDLIQDYKESKRNTYYLDCGSNTIEITQSNGKFVTEIHMAREIPNVLSRFFLDKTMTCNVIIITNYGGRAFGEFLRDTVLSILPNAIVSFQNVTRRL